VLEPHQAFHGQHHARRIMPGRPGRLPTQGSHGSGRADFLHPARPANHSHAPGNRYDPPLTTASTAIRRPCVDRGSGLGVPALFPGDGRLTRKPPSLHRLRAGGPFAGFPGTMRPSDSCLPFGPGSLGSLRTYRREPAMILLPCCGSLATAGPGFIWDRLTRTAEGNGGNRQASQVPGGPQGGRADF